MYDGLPDPVVHNPQMMRQETPLLAQFYLRPQQNPERTAEEGRPIFEEAEFIRIMVPGDKSSVIDRPVRLGNSPKHDNQQFAKAYMAFKQGLEQTPEGTPLKEWPLISQSQVKELDFFNVKTVEQLALMPDTAVQNFTGVFQLRQQAQGYLARAKEAAPSVQLEAEIAKKDEQLAAMQVQMTAMAEELKSIKNGDGAPKRRGRPPKNV